MRGLSPLQTISLRGYIRARNVTAGHPERMTAWRGAAFTRTLYKFILSNRVEGLYYALLGDFIGSVRS